MPQVVIDNPILNSPFSEPTRHFRFSDEEVRNFAIELMLGRRVSELDFGGQIDGEASPAAVRAERR